MKVLDKITLEAMLSKRKNCPICLGKAYILIIRPDLDATRFRVAIPCPCVKQVVRVEED